MTAFQHIQVPAQGHKITVNADFSLNVPDDPIIPFIEGDGTGPDIWRACGVRHATSDFRSMSKPCSGNWDCNRPKVRGGCA